MLCGDLNGKKIQKKRGYVYGGSLVAKSCLPASLRCPWDSPGKNTGVGCHSLLQGIEPGSPALYADSLPTELYIHA